MEGLGQQPVGYDMAVLLLLCPFLASKSEIFHAISFFCICLISCSQPFWGNMVAGAGAGPEPIPQKSLTAENLADAIKHCLRPEALSAAQKIADLMKSESGVEAAVASFHRCLPLDKMRCHILSDEPAAWAYDNSLTEPLFLSKTAARLLVEGSRVNPKDLKL